MKNIYRRFIFLLILSFVFVATSGFTQEQSISRLWGDELLGAIQRDFARPVVHARNLFHVSAAQYDAWAAYEPGADNYFLGNSVGGFPIAFDGVPVPDDIVAAQEEALSFASYRLITARFENSPGVFTTMVNINALMANRGYNVNNTSTDYVNGGPAELGNYIAEQILLFGLQDGANESGAYANQYYEPINPTIEVQEAGNPNVIDPNRWQTITLTDFIDQSGNPISGTPPFLGAEWGNVVPFSMTDADKVTYNRDGNDYHVYHDPGAPAFIDVDDPSGLESFYKWGFLMVSIWQSHLDEDDQTLWDVSPASLGNIDPTDLPTTFEEFQNFYNYFDGNINSSIAPGYSVNPVTGIPYEPQMVKRADYGRVLAEFWADGPDSETPPGHWYHILHTVSDHPLFERKWMGEGEVLSNLEYDVKAQFAMGGAMHDAAIAAWSIKGWYDYARPVAAIRFMGDQGQCTDDQLPSYNPAGLPLIPGYVELIEPGDPLAGDNNEHVNKIKLFSWAGPYVDDPEFDAAGVDWIRSEDWWPYQRPTFVTPPFAGYVSGHSTYSRAAAELMTLMTGDPYFPGGKSEFVCEANEFLEFENGPSETVVLEWATYRDASDQCSLSRIWGGIHPPMDDIPGRLIGIELGPEAMDYANSFFNSQRPQVELATASQEQVNISDIGGQFTFEVSYDREMNVSIDPTIEFIVDNPITDAAISQIDALWVDDHTYQISYDVLNSQIRLTDIFIRIDDAEDVGGFQQNVFLSARPFNVDTERPEVVSITPSAALINDQVATAGSIAFTVTFDEPCDSNVFPVLSFNSASDLSSTLVYNASNSMWTSETEFYAEFAVADNNEEIDAFGVLVEETVDVAGNTQIAFESVDLVSIDTRNPIISDISVSNSVLNQQSAGNMALVITLTFDEEMNTSLSPQFNFPADDPMGTSLFLNVTNSMWLDANTYQRAYNLINWEEEFFNIDVALQGMRDLAGNDPSQTLLEQLFIIDTKRPDVSASVPSVSIVADNEVGSASFQIEVTYNEPMDVSQTPVIQLTSVSTPIGNSLVLNLGAGNWIDETTFSAVFNVNDENKEIAEIGLTTSFGKDAAGNNQFTYSATNVFALDTKNPDVVLINANTYLVDNSNVGDAGFSIVSIFSEEMLSSNEVELSFDQDVSSVLTLNNIESGWLNNSTFNSVFDVANTTANIADIDVVLGSATDVAGNLVNTSAYNDYYSINITVVSVSDLDELGVKLYPNPLHSGDELMLNLGQSVRDLNFVMVDALGRNVANHIMSNIAAGSHIISIPELSAGLYFVNLQVEGKSATYKLMIQK